MNIRTGAAASTCGARRLLAVVVLFTAGAAGGCGFAVSPAPPSSGPLAEGPAHFPGSLVASALDTPGQRQAALGTAEHDLACHSLHIVTEIDGRRRSLNGTFLRFVIEGCGQRALYLEGCEFPPGDTSFDTSRIRCEYLLVSTLPLPRNPPP